MKPMTVCWLYCSFLLPCRQKLVVCTYQQHMMRFGKSCSHCMLQLSTGTVAVYTGMTLAFHLCNQIRQSKLLTFSNTDFHVNNT